MAVKRITPFVVIVAVCLMGLGRLTLAQGADFRIGPWVMGAGGQSQTTDFQVQGSAGQSNAGIAEGGEFRLKGGMWPITPIVVNGSSTQRLFLPVILRQNPVVIQPPPPLPATWQRVGNSLPDLSALAVQDGQLFTGMRKRQNVSNGGLYKRPLASCETTLGTNFSQISSVNAPGLSLVFAGAQGVLAAFEGKIFYTADSGNSWTQTASAISKPNTVATAGGSTFYAGTEASGIYRSTDGGVTWEQRITQPNIINSLRQDRLDANLLWVGTQDSGVFVFTLDLLRLTERNSGLAPGNSRSVWDFEFDGAGNIYVATQNGVFRWDGVWQPFGLQGVVQARSLAVVGDQLYAGAQSNETNTVRAGVWRRPLVGGDWTQVLSAGWNANYTVRDLLHDPTYCKGVLAATNDGVWLYK